MQKKKRVNSSSVFSESSRAFENGSRILLSVVDELPSHVMSAKSVLGGASVKTGTLASIT